ncbi:MAG TPA: YhfC family glutamic-type intramembrane protease [Anaerolineales bacterium]|nr:YhfC family glutamic-type intramembrane protease [Anaerolineales bacterium]
MLSVAYVISFLGMIFLPIGVWVYFTRRFALSWKLVLAGGLTFIASQILHIPLVVGIGSFLQKIPLWVNAAILGLLAGVFEETARYILFKFILRNTRTWKEGILVGFGHGGTEAVLLGIFAALTFVNMLIYRNVDLSTVPGIPADQLELAKTQVAAYWSAPTYMALIGFIERIFAMCLHLSLSIMVLYALASGKPLWFWLALLWHAWVDAVAVYIGQVMGILQAEGLIAIFALVSLWIVLRMRLRFPQAVDLMSASKA